MSKLNILKFWIWLFLAMLWMGENPLQAQEQSFEVLAKKGLKAYSDGNYDQAIEYFIQARTIRDEADLLYNIARAYDKKKVCHSAKEFYTRYIERSDADPEVVERAKKYRKALGECPTTGSLILICQPPNAEISLDDGEITGKCGVMIKEIPPGKHIAVINAKAHESMAIEVEIKMGKITSQKVQLTPISELDWMENTWGWILVDVGGALATTAVIVDILNLSNRDDLKKLPIGDPDRKEIEDSYRLHQALIIGFGSGAIAFVGAGIVAFITGWGLDQDNPSEQSWNIFPLADPEGHWGTYFQYHF